MASKTSGGATFPLRNACAASTMVDLLGVSRAWLDACTSGDNDGLDASTNHLLANVGSRLWLEHAPHSHRVRIIIIRKQT